MASTRSILLGFVLLWAQLIAAAPLDGFLGRILGGGNTNTNTNGINQNNGQANNNNNNVNTVTGNAPAPTNLAGNTKLPIVNAGAADIIPNRYIVVYNSTFSDDAIDAKMSSFSLAIKKRNLNKRGLGGRDLSTEVMSFKMNTWRAMALDADDSMIMDINSADEVEYVEADHWVTTRATIAQTNAPPGLQRLSESRPGQNAYTFDDSAGQGITAYVVDTGVRVTHSEFEGRATFAANFVNQVVRFLGGFILGSNSFLGMLIFFIFHRTRMKMVTVATSPVPLPVQPLESPKRPTSKPSRSSTPRAAAKIPEFSTACSLSLTTSTRTTSRARQS